MNKVAVLGSGSWGTALAITLAKKGYDTNIWARRSSLAQELNENKENKQYLPGVVIPNNIYSSADLEKVIHKAKYIVMSIPTHGIREVALQLKNIIKPDSILINTSKGIEPGTLMLQHEVIEEEIPEMYERIALLSGPSHAEEVGKELPTAVVVASRISEVATEIQDLFISPKFRVYTNLDVIGVEVGGALKNVIALATGIADGLGFGDNTKAAIITRGLTEIARIGKKMGANDLTFAGLTGIGDLVVTCNSMHSRNRRAGIAIGQGKKLDTILAEMGMVVEGVRTCKATMELSKKYDVELPISKEVYNVLFEGVTPEKAVVNLMTRLKTHEVESVF
ncbi:glycerol 3-phosphate dehydrogenase (NAD(P)+) [Desulfonispora thiosulfatigenes DSM 11270]|uniref:Glycerol-3-phosphate dehydrogenase [NAD(P)+] n=1 Tax=Desulfonispora thiosulfatigenes DSM 11270 TaxID=656914 RepID=A0A1W1VM56_DESTI|nr:NAD(P)H-dependent glycerol-3-phosphate dehydrogenase [Desulfonispora thiosulfatigenes]SMB94459.1 glycerol 3-phosphate dehydrogenase (NAD(P)+) [Desulfonispora thiosulfatigenes DSM 11270]